jgi:hypothetical protein
VGVPQGSTYCHPGNRARRKPLTAITAFPDRAAASTRVSSTTGRNARYRINNSGPDCNRSPQPAIIPNLYACTTSSRHWSLDRAATAPHTFHHLHPAFKEPDPRPLVSTEIPHVWRRRFCQRPEASPAGCPPASPAKPLCSCLSTSSSPGKGLPFTISALGNRE